MAKKQKFNYKWWRSRYHPKTVTVLPDGWMKVSDAMQAAKMSRAAIACRYLTGKWDSIRYSGQIYVRIE
jgi:hypothetical protein